jgi:hypothetical protein
MKPLLNSQLTIVLRFTHYRAVLHSLLCCASRNDMRFAQRLTDFTA